MKPYIVYDIETYRNDRIEEYIEQKKIRPAGNLKDPAKIEANIEEKRAALREKAALSPITGRVTCIGLSYCGDFHFFINQDERALLEDVDTFVAGKQASTFIGHNVNGFDLPFLRMRHIANRLPMPPWLAPGVRHDDTMLMLGRQNFIGLADAEWLMDVRRDSKKEGIQALELWEAGDWAALEAYCRDDVESTERLWLNLNVPEYL